MKLHQTPEQVEDLRSRKTAKVSQFIIGTLRLLLERLEEPTEPKQIMSESMQGVTYWEGDGYLYLGTNLSPGVAANMDICVHENRVMLRLKADVIPASKNSDIDGPLT